MLVKTYKLGLLALKLRPWVSASEEQILNVHLSNKCTHSTRKNLVLLFEWQGSVKCCCHSSEGQMAAVASGYFLICLVKLSVGFFFGSASVQMAGRTPSLGFLP